MDVSSRAQWCEVAQASIATTQGLICDMKDRKRVRGSRFLMTARPSEFAA
jgi:hypothetical protein